MTAAQIVCLITGWFLAVVAGYGFKNESDSVYMFFIILSIVFICFGVIR